MTEPIRDPEVHKVEVKRRVPPRTDVAVIYKWYDEVAPTPSNEILDRARARLRKQ